MISFSDVLNNIGDFRSSALQPGSVGNYVQAREGTAGADASTWHDTGDAGYRRVATARNRQYQHALMEAAHLIKRAFDGDDYARLMMRDAMQGRFREALGISDFPNLFGDIIDRSVLASYRETPYTWNMIAKTSQVNDFRMVKRFSVDYGTSAPTVPIEMGAGYPETKIADNAWAGSTGQASGAANTAGYWSYSIQKYGKRMPFFWETFVNDDLNAIKDTPARFGRSMRRGEERFVTSLFAKNTTFFASGFKNIVNATNSGGAYTAVNPALSITALAQAMVVMSKQRDKDNEPIEIESVVLVVPPALKVTAQNILNADYFWANDQGGTIGYDGSLQRLNVANWARNIVTLAVNYYLPILDATATGDTGWYLFANPQSGRPALEMGQLRGHTTPELYMKMPNSIQIGEGNMGPGSGIAIPGAGAMSNPSEGDFDTDSIHYKIRHCWGGTTIDPKMAVFSDGSGN